jgi:hypothetical protein
MSIPRPIRVAIRDESRVGVKSGPEGALFPPAHFAWPLASRRILILGWL